MQRWTVSLGFYGAVEFPLNPREGALPSFERQYTVQPGPMNPVIFEAPRGPQTMAFAGTIRDKAHYDFFVNWFNSNSVCTITDENGQTYTGVLKRFTPKRKNRHSHPWAADYDAEVLVWAGSDF